MRTLAPWLCVALALGLSACEGVDDGDDPNGLPLLHEDFPQIPRSGATQPHVVAPCYTVDLPFDMERIDVQGIDSNVARFDSDSVRLFSDCGAYDVGYDGELVAQQSVVVEGFDGSLFQYAGSFEYDDQTFTQVVVLHLTRPGGFNGVEHLDVGVFGNDGITAALGILASVRDIWP